MDLTIVCGDVYISSNKSSYQKAIEIDLNDIDRSYLNNVDVAKCIEIETYIEAI